MDGSLWLGTVKVANSKSKSSKKGTRNVADEQLEQFKNLALKGVMGDLDEEGSGLAIDLFVKHLEESGRLLPAGGVTIHERGNRRGKASPGLEALISRVGRAFPGRYTRTVTVWPVEGEPNDNWPKYIGPWREETTQGLP